MVRLARWWRRLSGGLTLGIISHQPVTRSMAGPSIRCWEFARALAGEAEVRLLAPAPSNLEPTGFTLVEYGDEGPLAGVEDCDVIICQGFALSLYPRLKQLGRHLVVDMYVPMALEALEQNAALKPDRRRDAFAQTLAALVDQALAGDFFICASERQRDYWLGLLTAVGRVNPEAYAGDDCLRGLIDVVPFGVSGEQPQAGAPVLKGVHPAIGADDKLVLWGGGIYNWLDPLTPIQALGLLREQRPDIKLYFMGTRHPDPHVPHMTIYDEAVELSRSLGLLDETVFFNDQWVPYEQRASYLLEADIGVSANRNHIETRFSFRTRILDYIWAGLPIVTTDGDVLSDLVRERGLGLVASSNDAAALAGALEELLDDQALRRRCEGNLATRAEAMRWDNIVAPLRERIRAVAAGQEFAGASAGGFGFEQAELDRRQEEIARRDQVVAEKATDIEKLWEMVAELQEGHKHLHDVIADKNRQLKNPFYFARTVINRKIRRK